MANNNNTSYKFVTGPLADQVFSLQNPRFDPDPYVQFGSKQCYLPLFYSKNAQVMQDFQVRPDDVWLVSFPKTGTTWASEMIWMIGNDLNFERATTESGLTRMPFVEIHAVFGALHNPDPNFISSMKLAQNLESPRFIKTHLPWNMLPTQIQSGEVKPKLIYIARHPKDVVVSFYHHKKLMEGYLGSMDALVEAFIGDLVLYGPYWTHLQEFYDKRAESNILLITYEAMKKDLSSVIQKTATFLGKPTLNQSQMEKLLAHLSFENMKSNPCVNFDELAGFMGTVHNVPAQTTFIRKGETECWKEELSEDSIQKLDKWIDEYKENNKDNNALEIWDE